MICPGRKRNRNRAARGAIRTSAFMIIVVPQGIAQRDASGLWQICGDGRLHDIPVLASFPSATWMTSKMTTGIGRSRVM